MGAFLSAAYRGREPLSDDDGGLYALFLYCCGMALVAGDKVSLIAFNLAFQNDRRLTISDTLAEFRGHLLNLRLRQIQLGDDLSVRQVQADQIRAQHPNPQRRMTSREGGVGKIIETAITITATISLATNLVRVVAILDDLTACAMRAANALRPSQLTHRFIAFRIVGQPPNRNRHP